MEKLRFNVGDVFSVETPGTFRIAANSKGLYLAPDDAIRIVRLPDKVGHLARKNIDNGQRRG